MGTSAQEGGWCCGRCGETSPTSLDACWNCGSSPDGEPDPGFEPVRDVGDVCTDEPLWSPPQWSLREMFWWMTFSALFLVALMHLPTGLVLAGVLVWIALTPFAPRINQRLRNLARRILYHKRVRSR